MHDVSYHALHGRLLRIAWDARMARAAIETILDYHGFVPGAPNEAAWCLTYEADIARPPEATEVARHESGISIWRADALYYIDHSDGVIAVDTARGAVTGVLPASPGGVSTPLYVALTFVVLLLLEVDGWYAMHAACLVHPSGAGVLLVGPSDSGKSTMSLHLVEQGWHYLSDDSVLLRAVGEQVEVFPLRPDFCVDPDAEDLFPALADAQNAMLTDAEKWRIRVEQLFPGQQSASALPALVLFPRVAGTDTTRVERLRPIDTLMALLPQASLLRREPQHAARFSELLRHLVQQAPGYRFHSGADVHHDGAHLATLVARLLPAPHAHHPTKTESAHD